MDAADRFADERTGGNDTELTAERFPITPPKFDRIGDADFLDAADSGEQSRCLGSEVGMDDIDPDLGRTFTHQGFGCLNRCPAAPDAVIDDAGDTSAHWAAQDVDRFDLVRNRIVLLVDDGQRDAEALRVRPADL